jgi:hypothetical protein
MPGTGNQRCCPGSSCGISTGIAQDHAQIATLEHPPVDASVDDLGEVEVEGLDLVGLEG